MEGLIFGILRYVTSIRDFLPLEQWRTALLTNQVTRCNMGNVKMVKKGPLVSQELNVFSFEKRSLNLPKIISVCLSM